MVSLHNDDPTLNNLLMKNGMRMNVSNLNIYVDKNNNQKPDNTSISNKNKQSFEEL